MVRVWYKHYSYEYEEARTFYLYLMSNTPYSAQDSWDQHLFFPFDCWGEDLTFFLTAGQKDLTFDFFFGVLLLLVEAL